MVNATIKIRLKRTTYGKMPFEEVVLKNTDKHNDGFLNGNTYTFKRKRIPNFLAAYFRTLPNGLPNQRGWEVFLRVALRRTAGDSSLP